MRFDKFTTKFQQAFADAQSAAVGGDHAYIEPQHLLLALKGEDIERAKREGKLAIVIGVEGGKLLEGDLQRLSEFYKLGLRELQLRWAVPNQLVEKTALTNFGRAVVKECHKLGIIVDSEGTRANRSEETAVTETMIARVAGRSDLAPKRLAAGTGCGPGPPLGSPSGSSMPPPLPGWGNARHTGGREAGQPGRRKGEGGTGGA